MKFLCVPCDEPMTLSETRGPDEGSLTVVFACPACGHRTAMLTNAMETQVVRTLGVKVGGRTVPAEPMEMVRDNLVHRREEAAPPAAKASSGSKCPFTGMVEEAYARQEEGVAWSAEAEQRLERIPSFARSMVRKSIEDYARTQGLSTVDGAVMDAVKGQFGM